MKARGRARHNLIRTSGTDFQREVIGLLSEVLEGSSESKRLGRLDRQGIDIYTYTPDYLSIELALQCKGFEVDQYGADQHRQCQEEIKKYKRLGPAAAAYWLVLNRPVTARSYRDELLHDLADLRNSGKVDSLCWIRSISSHGIAVQITLIEQRSCWRAISRARRRRQFRPFRQSRRSSGEPFRLAESGADKRHDALGGPLQGVLHGPSLPNVLAN